MRQNMMNRQKRGPRILMPSDFTIQYIYLLIINSIIIYQEIRYLHMHNKSRPLDIQIEVVNKMDWKTTNNLIIKVKGMFRNSMWKVGEHSHHITGDIIQITIHSMKVGEFGAMVLTPFEILEKVEPVDKQINYKIRVLIDGDEYTSHSF
jgi:hypothetical protein